MKLHDIVKVEGDDIDSESIEVTQVVGLKLTNPDHDLYELKNLSLSSFLADSQPENAKNAISQLRSSTANISKKTDKIRDHIADIKSINQTDIDQHDFEKTADRPMSFKTAIDTITETAITVPGLQSLVNDVYSVLWEAVNDMFTTGFQTSMYARQYTGTTQGISDKNPVYTEIVFEEDE